MEAFVVLGSGVAGLTAALYAGRAKFHPLVLEGPAPGGTVLGLPKIENYPGFPDGVEGFALLDGMRRQAEAAGARFEGRTATGIEPLAEGGARLRLDDGATLESRTVVVATGIAPRPLGVEGELALRGRGVSYCATCDAPLYKGKRVLVAGNGGAALRDALVLARVAESVEVLSPEERFAAAPSLLARAEGTENVRLRTGARVAALVRDGEGRFAGVELEGGERLAAAAVFVAMGVAPATEAFRGTLATDAAGFLLPEVLPKGIFAAGDVCSPKHRQIAAAVGTGCAAAMDAIRYLEEGAA
jgi:thioredoxin reductase (NADPH)